MASHIRESKTMNSRRNKVLLNASAFIAITGPIFFGAARATPIHAQSQNQSTAAISSDYRYDVASIKAVQPGMVIRQTYQNTPHEFIASYVSVQTLVRDAYTLEDNQIFGAPNWLDSDLYEIHAKTSDSVAEKLEKLSPVERSDRYREMLKALLADRFKLAIHRETKEMPIYELSIAKNGIRLQEPKPGDTYANGIIGGDGRARGAGAIRSGTEADGHKFIRAQAVPIAYLVSALTSELGSRIADQTGLTGKYDFSLRWTSDGPGQMEGTQVSGSALGADSSGMSLLAALQDELGLRLESRKGKIDAVVIDHVERATPN
jgi:uncharacterized protein (TIGR03435 family)